MLMIKNKYLVALKKVVENKKKTIIELRDFCVEAFIYGLMLGILALYFLQIPLTIHSIIALGLLKYFITDEFPFFIKRLRDGFR